MNSFFRRVSVFVVFALLSVQVVARPRLYVVHPLPGSTVTFPIDISADGRVVAGTTITKAGLSQAYRQTRPYGPKKIPVNIPVESMTVALSADGSVVLGSTYNAASLPRAFRWTKATGSVDLSSNPDLVIFATGLSGDGRIAVGEYEQQIDNPRPFYWSAETGLQPLSISAYDRGYTFGVNHDGSVIVGYVTATNGGSTNHACRWVQMGQVELLDPLDGGSYASAVTPDGSVIIGQTAGSDDISRAFRWTFRGGMEWIELGDAFHGFALRDLSADGQRLVGNAETANSVHVGVLWTPENGIQDLNQAFRSVLPRGWRFSDATAISADGRWIVGGLENSRRMFRGYILDTSGP